MGYGGGFELDKRIDSGATCLAGCCEDYNCVGHGLILDWGGWSELVIEDDGM